MLRHPAGVRWTPTPAGPRGAPVCATAQRPGTLCRPAPGVATRRAVVPTRVAVAARRRPDVATPGGGAMDPDTGPAHRHTTRCNSTTPGQVVPTHSGCGDPQSGCTDPRSRCGEAQTGCCDTRAGVRWTPTPVRPIATP